MFALNPNPARYEGKTVMVVGAGRIQEPAIQTAKYLGLNVVTVDNNPQAPGLKWADYPILISTRDTEACIEAARSYKVDGVMTSGSDQGACTAAAIASSLGLPGIPLEAARNSTNKITIRRIMEENNIPSPRYKICKSRIEVYKALKSLGLPVVIKPPDAHSSLGVSVVNKVSEIKSALDWATRFTNTGVWVVEEYISASCNGGGIQAFVVDGEVIIVSFISGKLTPPPHRGHIYVSVPAEVPQEKMLMAKELVKKAVKAMGITYGPVHIQMRMSAEGPRLIELTPRLAGVCVNSYLIPLAQGVNLIQAAIDVCLGYKPDLTPRFNKGACQHFIILPPGTVEKVPCLEQFNSPDLVDIKLFIKPGDIIPEYHSFSVAPGYCITKGETLVAAIETASGLCREVSEKIIVR